MSSLCSTTLTGREGRDDDANFLLAMVSNKKDKTRPKKDRSQPDDDDFDDSDSGKEEEEEPVESDYAKRKREKGKAAFFGMCRSLLALVPLALVLSQQPFMMKPRTPGVNRAKIVPLQLAVAGAIHWAETSPSLMRQPQARVYLNATARALMAPFEYSKAQSSKRAMPAEKTIAGAYKKTEKALARVVDGDAALREVLRAPGFAHGVPNVPLLGAYALVLGALLAPLIGGLEYVVVLGCGALMHGSRAFGMEPQPELYTAGVLAIVGCLCMDQAKKKPEDEAQKKGRKTKKR